MRYIKGGGKMTGAEQKEYGDKMWNGGVEHGRWEARMINPRWYLAVWTFAVGVIAGITIALIAGPIR